MLTVHELDLEAPDGRVVHAYDTGATGRPDELVVFWHGGTPNTGLPPAPLFEEAERLGLRFLGADRPGYGGSTPLPGGSVGDVAVDVAAVADHAGVPRFATLGHSGGGPRALATAALLPERTLAAAAVSSPAPPEAAGLDRFAGMADGPAREQRAAAGGRAALTALLEADEFDERMFTAEDFAALEGPWGWFLPVVAAATVKGVGGQVDDGLAQAAPWGFALEAVRCPVLVVHGTADRLVPASHGGWLADHVPGAELVAVEGAGHISVLETGPEVLRRLRALADGQPPPLL